MAVEDFRPLAEAAGRRHGVPPDLILAVIQVESSGNPRAVRHEHHLADESRGLMQVLTRTAAEHGVEDPDKLWEPEANIDVGTRYLAAMYAVYPEIPDGDVERWRFAVAAYNAGRGNINEATALAREALGLRRGDLTTPGLWQDWIFVSGFLHQVTGASNARTTKRHVELVLHNWGLFAEAA